MSKAYGLIYNSYWNREIKKKNTIQEYIADIGKIRFVTEGINFYPRDGIRATLKNVSAYDDADYVVITDDNGNILSRWFIMENMNESYNFYELTLKRDVIADDLAGVLDSTFYIEKGTIPSTDPFIYNPEKTSPYNQIKTKETLLKDETKTRWLVAYVSKKREQDFTFTSKINATAQITAASQSTWQYANFLGEGQIADISQVNVTARASNVDGKARSYNGYFSRSQLISTARGDWKNESVFFPLQESGPHKVTDEEIFEIFNKVSLPSILDDFDYDYTITDSYLDNLNGKNVKFTDTGKVFKITVKKVSGPLLTSKQPAVNSAAFLTLKNAFLTNTAFVWKDQYATNPFSYFVNGTRLSIILTEITDAEITYTLPKTTDTKGLKDQPFDIIMCPYELETGKVTDDSFPYYSWKVGDGNYQAWAYNNTAALDIMTQLSADPVCYDLQLLPYYVPGDGIEIDSTGSLRVENTAQVDKAGTQASSVFFWWPTKSSFRNIIQLEEPVYITEPKVQNECDLYRFSSPNYGSSFDFNAAMNGGLFTVEINCTYLPIQPYIHVNPTFGGLYGKRDDATGLICGGNYSLSAISNSWTEYVRNNKNYAEIFQTGISNLEAEREIQRVEQITAGTIGAISSGATSGALVGGVAGGIVGGVAGVASAIGAGIDYSNSEKRFNNNIRYQTQMQNYQLGNIQARPTSLSRTSSYNVDNKYWPVLEYYTCTEEEKQALRDQIKYTGMTVMRTGTLRNYLGGFVKGKLIRTSSTLNNDSDYISVVAEELDKGVYIYNEEGGEAN